MGHKSVDILIIDDHEDSASVLARLLRHVSEDYDVTVSNSFHDAIDVATERHFDLLLCDIGLPDGDGCELLLQVRAMYPVRAIALTAYTFPADLQRYREAGFDYQLTKPTTLDAIVDSIERVIAAPLKK